MRYVCTEDDDDVLTLFFHHNKTVLQITDELYDETMDVFLSKDDVQRLINDLKTCLENMED
jgi:hypothetical protein